MNDHKRAALIQVLTKFLRDAAKEGTIGHGLHCVNTAIASIESLLEADRVDDLLEDAHVVEASSDDGGYVLINLPLVPTGMGIGPVNVDQLRKAVAARKESE